MDVAKSSDGEGSVFRDMAATFQANVRKRSNNDWSSLIKEGVLVSEMIGTDVSRTLKVKLTQFKKSVSRIFNLPVQTSSFLCIIEFPVF